MLIGPVASRMLPTAMSSAAFACHPSSMNALVPRPATAPSRSTWRRDTRMASSRDCYDLCTDWPCIVEQTGPAGKDFPPLRASCGAGRRVVDRSTAGRQTMIGPCCDGPLPCCHDSRSKSVAIHNSGRPGRTPMSLPPRLPTVSQILELAKTFGMTLTEADAASFCSLMAGSIASYARLDELAEPKLPVKYPRDPGYRPPAEENPYNAWYWKTNITGANVGVLAGERVAVKDNICVAGVPMMNGSRVLEGYVPDVDATVVTRVLDAGGGIAGKAACEDLCFSAGSHTCATGPIRNPYNPKHSTGGSSGGSAALVAAGEVTMALGGDQGGSIRTPSAWCGVFGLKPSWGLVPMTGGMPISYSVDHCGPICSSTENIARLLTAIAGPDPHDPRTINARVSNYMEALTKDVRGLRIALLQEGFNHPVSDEATSRKVRDAIADLQSRGAVVEEVKIPMHLDGPHIWTGIILEGAAEMMIK